MTTTVYLPHHEEGYEYCHPTNPDNYDTFRFQIDGARRSNTWSPVPMHLVREADEGKSRLASDSPWLGTHSLIFRQSAIEKLGALLREYGELLPLSCPGTEIMVFNPTRVIDALDEEASSVERYKSSGRIMRITHYAFRPDIVAGVDIFKIPNQRVSSTYVGDRFVQLWNSSGLVGLRFKRIWSSD